MTGAAYFGSSVALGSVRRNVRSARRGGPVRDRVLGGPVTSGIARGQGGAQYRPGQQSVPHAGLRRPLQTAVFADGACRLLLHVPVVIKYVNEFE